MDLRPPFRLTSHWTRLNIDTCRPTMQTNHMSTPLFDTRQADENLQNAGCAPQLAKAIVLTIDEALTGGVSTKADIAEVKTEIAEVKTEIAEVKAELKGDISALKAELKGDISALRAELKGDISALEAELKGDISALEAELKGEITTLKAELKGDIHASAYRVILAVAGLGIAAIAAFKFF